MDDALAEDLKAAAGAGGESVNTFATRVLAMAVEPRGAGDELGRLRERLRRVGLLAELRPAASEPPDVADVDAAGRAAAHGTRLSDLVSEGRG